MSRSLFVTYMVLITSVTAQTPCPGNTAIKGYGNIADLNTAMAAEASKIKGGATPNPPYVFTICPNTILNAKQPLTPLLSGAEFVCGTDGALSNSCTFLGGTTQVSIQDSTVPGYPLQNVTFKGITFKGSSQAAVVGSASAATTANFNDCSWTDFTGNSAVQINSTSPKAMTVAITGGNAQNGNANAIVSNDNGSLQINGLAVSGSKGLSGIVTSGGGITSLSNGTFASDDFQTVTSTTSGGSLKVINTDVSGIGSTLQNVFSASGTGTTMDVNGTTIHDITAPSLWNGITYGQGSTGEVQGSQVLRNSGLQYGVDTVDGSTVTVANSNFESNSAAGNTISSIMYALNNSKLISSGTNVTNNNGFTTFGFTGFNSFTQYDNTTFQGGTRTLIAVFIDQNSKFGFKNIVFNNVLSQACPPPNQREFLEDVGSQCFYRGPGNCRGICGVVTNHTLAPSAVTTRAPSKLATVAPSAAPVAITSSPSPPVTSKPTLAGTFGATTSPTPASPSSTVIGQPPSISPTSKATAATALPSIAPVVPSATPVAPSVAPVAVTPGPTAAGTSQPTFVGTVSPTTSAPSVPTKVPSKPIVPTKTPTAADKGSKKPTKPVAKKTRAPVHRTRAPRARKTRPPVRRTRAPKTRAPGVVTSTQAPSISAYPTYIVGPSSKPTQAPSKVPKAGKKGKKGKKGKQASLAPIVSAATSVPSPLSSATAVPSPSGSVTGVPTSKQAAKGKGGHKKRSQKKGSKKAGATSAPFAAGGTAAPTATPSPANAASPLAPAITMSPTMSLAPFLSGVVPKGGGKSAKKGIVKGIMLKKVRPQYASKQKKGQITMNADNGGAPKNMMKGGM